METQAKGSLIPSGWSLAGRYSLLLVPRPLDRGDMQDCTWPEWITTLDFGSLRYLIPAGVIIFSLPSCHMLLAAARQSQPDTRAYSQ